MERVVKAGSMDGVYPDCARLKRKKERSEGISRKVNQPWVDPLLVSKLMLALERLIVS